jgi:hypothetical protein
MTKGAVLMVGVLQSQLWQGTQNKSKMPLQMSTPEKTRGFMNVVNTGQNGLVLA